MTAVPLPKKRSKRQTLYNYSHVRVTGSDIEELLGIYVAPQKPKAIIMSLEPHTSEPANPREHFLGPLMF